MYLAFVTSYFNKTLPRLFLSSSVARVYTCIQIEEYPFWESFGRTELQFSERVGLLYFLRHYRVMIYVSFKVYTQVRFKMLPAMFAIISEINELNELKYNVIDKMFV